MDAMNIGNIEPLLPVILIVLVFAVGAGLIVRNAVKVIRRERKGVDLELVQREAAESRRDYP